MNRRGKRLLLLTLLPACAAAPAQELQPTTHVFETVGDLELEADVYRAPGDEVRPAALWFHGGALLFGDRRGVPPWIYEPVLDAGMVLVSVDYRLAPEVKLPAIQQDVRRAYAWLRREGPDRFRIDPDRIAVMGASAGGFLTLSAGFLLRPRPRVLASWSGYGDIAAEWLTRPAAPYAEQPEVAEEVARAAIGDEVLVSGWNTEGRGAFYVYCRQQGLWPREVTGKDPRKDGETYDAFCPVRNVDADYPPTILVHGTEDRDVPFSQSVQMARALEAADVEHRLLEIEGAGHGLGALPTEQKAEMMRQVVDFVVWHLQ